MWKLIKAVLFGKSDDDAPKETQLEVSTNTVTETVVDASCGEDCVACATLVPYRPWASDVVEATDANQVAVAKKPRKKAAKKTATKKTAKKATKKAPAKKSK